MKTRNEKHRRAYSSGKHASRKTGGFGHILHDFGDFIGGFVPKGKNTEHSSYEAGWHDYEGLEQRYKKRRTSGKVGGGGGGSPSGLEGFIGIGVLIGVPILCVYAIYRGEQIGNEWTESRRQSTVVTNAASSSIVDAKPGSTLPTKKPKSINGIPLRDDLQNLVRTTVLAFNDAIRSGDFAEFHATLAKAFQKEASPEKLAGAFHEFVEKKLDFRDVANLDAKFTSPPAIVKQAGFDMLQLKGQYPTTPLRTKFELKYINENGEWKLSHIKIDTKN